VLLNKEADRTLLHSPLKYTVQFEGWKQNGSKFY